MYISRIRLENIRCFKEIDVSFPRTPTAHWTLVIGDNGTGKTALLRCIAIGLCDESSAAGLLKESEEGYVHRGAVPARGTITVWLYDPEDESTDLRIETTIEQHQINDDRYFERVTQVTEPSDAFPWHKVFAAGYGAGRGTSGTGDISGYSVINAVYNMFNYQEGLQNPELTIRRLTTKPTKNAVKKALSRILNLAGPEDIDFPLSGIALSGAWGEGMPLRDLADGYKTTFLWITDLLGWALSYDPSREPSEVCGVVLVDELEQHLHPRWQRKIVRSLRNCFPKIQFITSTHSPLCAIGSTDLTNEQCQLYLLEMQESAAVLAGPYEPPRGKRADQVLTSYLFGLPTTGDDQTRRDIERYRDLAGRRPTPALRKKLTALRTSLKQKLGSAETEIEQIVREELTQALTRRAQEAQIDVAVLDYEVRRQLRELLHGGESETEAPR